MRIILLRNGYLKESLIELLQDGFILFLFLLLFIM